MYALAKRIHQFFSLSFWLNIRSEHLTHLHMGSINVINFSIIPYFCSNLILTVTLINICIITFSKDAFNPVSNLVHVSCGWNPNNLFH